jgi:hypothetical protein
MYRDDLSISSSMIAFGSADLMECAQMVEEIFRLARKKRSNSGAIARIFDTAKRKISRSDVRTELISVSLLY